MSKKKHAFQTLDQKVQFHLVHNKVYWEIIRKLQSQQQGWYTIKAPTRYFNIIFKLPVQHNIAQWNWGKMKDKIFTPHVFVLIKKGKYTFVFEDVYFIITIFEWSNWEAGQHMWQPHCAEYQFVGSGSSKHGALTDSCVISKDIYRHLNFLAQIRTDCHRTRIHATPFQHRPSPAAHVPAVRGWALKLLRLRKKLFLFIFSEFDYFSHS
jgi:hypothetical protein